MISFQNLSKKAMRRASLMILQQSRSEGEKVFFSSHKIQYVEKVCQSLFVQTR
jgi:ABC-type Na+ transport system ATPase subunit NatA